jgi:putative tryptophan/tyrosine transport system substrate-binding protein
MKIDIIAVSLVAFRLGCPAEGAAQKPPVKNTRIGILGAMSAAAFAERLGVFREQLRELGYLEGKNIKFEERWAEGKLDRLDDLASKLVARKVDVLVTFGGSSPAVAAKKATRNIPIVMAAGGTDPAASGLVASLAHPGGNMTGVANSFIELRGKQMELLKETLPRLSRIAILWNPESRAGPAQQKLTEQEAQALGLKSQSLAVRSGDDFENAFAAAKRERSGAVLVTANPLIFSHFGHIAGLAITHRLPAIHPQKEFVEAGGLIMYGPSEAEIYRRAAIYVDKILKGARPGDLPVERPTKFQLIFNLKTAKHIGLTIPPNVLARADRVIR